MSSSAVASAWRRSLRSALLRGSPCHAGAGASRQASTSSGAAAGPASAQSMVPPPSRKGILLTGAMIGLTIARRCLHEYKR